MNVNLCCGNGTALPDSQNVLQLSKLFEVTTDYLLNDDYESDGDIPVVQMVKQEKDDLIIKLHNMFCISKSQRYETAINFNLYR